MIGGNKIKGNVVSKENTPEGEFVLNEQVKEVFEAFGFDTKYMFLTVADELINSVMIMETGAKSFVRLYWYDDDNQILYLECLAVNADYRRLGFGNELLELTTRISGKLGFEKINLMVEADSWMQKWYERDEYKFLRHADDIRFDWMQKILKY